MNNSLYLRRIIREYFENLKEDIFGGAFDSEEEKRERENLNLKQDESFIKQMLGNQYKIYKLYAPVVHAAGLMGNVFPSSILTKDKRKLGWSNVRALNHNYFVDNIGFNKMNDLYQKFFIEFNENSNVARKMLGFMRTNPRIFERIFESKDIIEKPVKKWVYIISDKDYSSLVKQGEDRIAKDAPEKDRKLKTKTYKRIKDFEIMKETEKASNIKFIVLVKKNEKEIYYTHADFWIPKNHYKINENGVLFLERWIYEDMTKKEHKFYKDSIVHVVPDKLELKKLSISRLSSMKQAIPI